MWPCPLELFNTKLVLRIVNPVLLYHSAWLLQSMICLVLRCPYFSFSLVALNYYLCFIHCLIVPFPALPCPDFSPYAATNTPARYTATFEAILESRSCAGQSSCLGSLRHMKTMPGTRWDTRTLQAWDSSSDRWQS